MNLEALFEQTFAYFKLKLTCSHLLGYISWTAQLILYKVRSHVVSTRKLIDDLDHQLAFTPPPPPHQPQTSANTTNSCGSWPVSRIQEKTNAPRLGPHRTPIWKQLEQGRMHKSRRTGSAIVSCAIAVHANLRQGVSCNIIFECFNFNAYN